MSSHCLSLIPILLLLFASSLDLIQSAVVWSGNFDPYTDSTVFDQWSWANQVGEYQWYIHGSQPTSKYLSTSPTYKNPLLPNSTESLGLKLTNDPTSQWNGQSMLRTELIPQVDTNGGGNSLGTGQMYYHFSLMVSDENPPDSSIEHQILFFESHFVQLKYGVAPTPDSLIFMTGSNSETTYEIPIVSGGWMNFAYDIDFSGQTVGLWYSTGGDPLQKVVDNVSAPTSTNSADFHVGVLRMSGTATEDWYLSGVYIESETITTDIVGAPPTSS